VSTVQSGRGREVWSEVEPFMLLGRAGAVPSTIQAVAEPRVPRRSRSTANLVLLTHQEVRS
jgi:hypothetical protein